MKDEVSFDEMEHGETRYVTDWDFGLIESSSHDRNLSYNIVCSPRYLSKREGGTATIPVTKYGAGLEISQLALHKIRNITLKREIFNGVIVHVRN